MAQMIDTHCHLNFDAYDTDRDAVIKAAIAANVTRIIIPAVDAESTPSAFALAQQYEGIFAAVGVHPNSTADFSDTTLSTLEEQVQQPNVVAVGEIGLDYHWDKSPKTKQMEAFETQLEFAAKYELPVIIHNREASEDVMWVLERWVKDLPQFLQNRPGVLHSFSCTTGNC